MTLNEIAVRLGVETDELTLSDIGDEIYIDRPALAIAHDVLAKLPVGIGAPKLWGLDYIGDEKWEVSYPHDGGLMFTGTFEQAVVALAERYLQP